jgi:hypothetical protein
MVYRKSNLAHCGLLVCRFGAGSDAKVEIAAVSEVARGFRAGDFGL